MKKLILTVVLLAFAASAYAEQEQIVYRKGTQQSFKGPAEYFTGDVTVDMLFPPNETAQFSGAYVTFQAGARTNCLDVGKSLLPGTFALYIHELLIMLRRKILSSGIPQA